MTEDFQSHESDVVVITGGSRGIGAEVARQAAKSGRNVAIIHRSDDAAANAVLAELRDLGVLAMRVKADVANEKSITTAFEEIRAFGPIVGLVNSAGITGGRMAVDELDAGNLGDLFQINVVGLMLCCREAVRQMATSRGGKGGAIVNLSSYASVIGGRGQLGHYAASKAAVDAFTLGAAKDLARDGIRMFSIRPTVTATDMTSDVQSDSEWLAAVERTIASGRIATAADIAIPIVRLLDDELAYLSGARIDAAGGGLLM